MFALPAADLEASVAFSRDEPWGDRVGTLSDPGGNRFDLLDQAYFEDLP